MTRFAKSIVLCVLAIVLACAPIHKAEALDPRIKAVATMSAYGAVGGALLGLASLAFGAGGRAVAKGASLGLYAGILFGSYIIISHNMKKGGDDAPAELEEGAYPEDLGPYSMAPREISQLGIQTNWRVEFERQRQEEVSKSFHSAKPAYYIQLINVQF